MPKKLQRCFRDADIRTHSLFGHIVKTVENSLMDFFDYIGDGYFGTSITEVCASFVSGPGMIEGSVMGDKLEGNHFEMMEVFDQDMEDVVVPFFSESHAEVGKGSFGRDVGSNAGQTSIFTSPFLISQVGQKSGHVGVAVNIAKQPLSASL